MTSEKRTRTRVPIKFETIVSTEGQDIATKSWDISLTGMKCAGNPAFRHNNTCTITLSLNTETVIKIEATILRIDENAVAMSFTGLDAESFYHLKNLIQYNTDQPETIEDELETPIRKFQA